MSSFNKVILLANLTRDIEIKHTNNNTAIGKFGVAMNHKYKTASGEQREEVTFVECTAFDKTAEVMAQYLGKGDQVHIEGRLHFEQWEDRNGGGKRSKLTVTVVSFQFVGGKYKARGSIEAKPGGGGMGGHDDSIPFNMGVAVQ